MNSEDAFVSHIQNKVVYSKATAKTFKGKRSNVPDPDDLSKDVPSPTVPLSPKAGIAGNLTVRGKLTRFVTMAAKEAEDSFNYLHLKIVDLPAYFNEAVNLPQSLDLCRIQ